MESGSAPFTVWVSKNALNEETLNGEKPDDVMEFICRTAKEYYDQSYKNRDTSTDTLLSAINTLESRFGNTLLEKENTEDKNKIALILDYIQVYISKDPAFRDIYVIKAFDYLKSKGEQIEKNQLELKLFAKEEIDKAVFRINSHTDQVGNRVIAVLIKRIDALEERILNNSVSNSTNSKTVDPEFKDAKTEYVDKWNERLFLHRRKEDKELTLKKTFISPLYKIIIPENEKTDGPKDNLKDKLEDFISNGKSLLIIGTPGIGKTSIVCYLADKYKNDPDVIILRFSDWSEDEWAGYENKRHGSILMKAITSKLGISEKDLRNKLLILDGFDEIKYYSNKNDLLSILLTEIRIIKGLRIIITSRENYIIHERVKFQYVLKLEPFNESKIKDFCQNISPSYKIDENDIANIDKEVYGIPVILYMALVTGIDITNESDKCSAYSKIFSYEGGIFDRFATESVEGYDDSSIHDITYEKEAFINILCKTAFTMFRISNSNSINFKEYQKIIDTEGKNIPNKTALWYDFPIDNLYEKSNHIEFVHKSIYEYFVAENVYYQLLYLFQLPDNKIKKEGLSILADLLCANIFTNEIIEFMCHRIKKSELNSMVIFKKLKSLSYNLLNLGPTNYITNAGCEKPPSYFKVYGTFFCNINIIFRNLLVLIHCWTQARSYNFPINGDVLNALEAYDAWEKEYITIGNTQYELDPLANLIISYIHNIDYIYELDLSHIAFLNIEINKSGSIHLFQNTNTYLIVGLIAMKDGFMGLYLGEIDFTGTFFHQISFDSSSLTQIKFYDSFLSNTTMCNTKCFEVRFDHATLEHILNKNSTFNEGIFAYTNIIECCFEDCDFFLTKFSFLHCYASNRFINCKFEKVKFSGIFDNCIFFNCHFISIELTDFNSFKDANFKDSTFSEKCELTGGVFTGADFRGANLDGAIYDHELDDAILD